MRQRTYFITLGIIVVGISTALLVGARFDAAWAGGTGYEPQQNATVCHGDVCTSAKRGEIISTFTPEEAANVTFGDVTIHADPRTEIKLIDGRAGHIAIDVIQGHILATGIFTIQTRNLRTAVDSGIAFTHYSWENKIEAVSTSGHLDLSATDGSPMGIAGAGAPDGWRCETLAPYACEEIKP